MAWRCALIQRWLPEYPDAEGLTWRTRLVARHLRHCPACQRELTLIEDTIRALKEAPVPMPGEDFWTAFNEELHLKLAQIDQKPAAAPKGRLLPYLLGGVPALAVLLLWLGGYVGSGLFFSPTKVAEAPDRSVLTTRGAPELAQPPGPAPASETGLELAAHGRGGGNHLPGPEKILYAGIDEGLWEEDMDLNWEVEPILADLSPQEREALVKKLTGREP